MAIQFPVIGGAYQGDLPEQNPQECINLRFAPDVNNGKHALVLRPGLTLFADTGVDSEVRGLTELDGVVYAVVGNQFFKITTAGVVTEITNGDSILTKTGLVTMSPGLGYIVIADGTYGYVYSKSTNALMLLSMEDHRFIAGGPVDYYMSKWIHTVPDSNRFSWSEVGNPAQYATDADLSTSYLGVLEPEGDLLRVMVDKSELIAFKKKGILFYDRMPDDDYSFRLRAGTEMSIGLHSAFAVAKLNNTFYWLGDDFNVYRANGYNPEVVSSPQISTRISNYSVTSDARAIAYIAGGLPYFQLTFPSDGVTWVYDVATNMWFKSSSWHDYVSDGKQHRANCHVYFDHKNLVGDYRNGRIYRIDENSYADEGHSIKWIRRCPAIDNQKELFSIAEIELEMGMGRGLSAGQGSDPQVIMRYSVDHGHNWSNEMWSPVGAMGAYGNRVVWGPLGLAREFVIEFSGSDPIRWVLMKAFARPGK